jgi:hypothetical protein
MWTLKGRTDVRFFDDEGKETFVIEPSRGTQGYDILFDNAYIETVQSLTEAFKLYEDTHKLMTRSWSKLQRTV